MKSLRYWLFKKLLKSYVEEVDQWELLKIQTTYGKIYITISREPITGQDSNYSEVN